MSGWTGARKEQLRQKNISRAIPFEDRYIPEPNSGCWLWTGPLTEKGYPNTNHNGRPIKGHRRSWIVHKGPIPIGAHVLHKCDVRSCINPDHLFLGTNADNVADKVAKGRAQSIKGSRQARAKLTESVIHLIRSDPRSSSIIAPEFGVSPSLIRQVKQVKLWRHAP